MTKDYLCLNCAKRFEVFEKSYRDFEGKKIKCPACGAMDIKERMGSPVIDFNGTVIQRDRGNQFG